MSLRTKLLQDIENLSNKDEKPYAGIEQELENSARPTTDIGSAAFGIIKDSLSGAEADTIDGLKHRIHRLDKLKQHVAEAKLGTEEETLILVSLTKVENGLKKHLDQKRTIKSRSANVISKMGSKLGEGLMTAMAGDPLATIAFKGAGLVKNFLQERKEKNEIKRATLRGDAQGMFSSTFSDAPSDPLGNEPLAGPLKMPKSEPEFDEPSVFHEPGTSYNGQDGDVLETLREISKDVKLLVRYAESAQIAREGSAFDAAETASEKGLGLGGKSTPDDKSSSKGEKGKGFLRNVLGDKFKDVMMSRVLMGIGKFLLSGTGLLVAGIGLAIVGGIRGWLKSKSWGVGKISGFIGGFFGGTANNAVMRTVGNMGKWALIGAGIGSFIPVIGTMIGGLVGALIGGILGWIGGKNIARFFDDFGTWISESFSNGFDMMKNFFTGMWTNARNMIDKVLNIVDTIKLTMLGWMKGIVDWLIDMDPTGLAGGVLGGVSEGLGGQQKAIQKQMDDRNKNRDDRNAAQTKREQDLIDKRNTQQANRVEKQKQRDAADGKAPLEPVAGQNIMIGDVNDRGEVYTRNLADGTPVWEKGTKAAEEAKANPARPEGSRMISSPGAGGPTTEAAPNSGFPKNIKASPTTKINGKSDSVTPAIPSGGSKSKDEMKNLALKELQEKGITDPTEQANILANLQAESNFTPQSENLNYSAKTLMKLFGPGSGNKVRVKTMEEAQAIADKGPEAVGNLIYGDRMGNAPDEGYKYRGRGLVQLTGKDNYTSMGDKLGLDLVNNPDLANDPAIAAKIQAQYYADRKKTGKFDYSDVNQVAKATGHAGGAAENMKRAKLAEQIKSDMASGKISGDGVIEPQNIKPTAPIIQASATEAGSVIDPDTGEKYYPDQQFASAQQSQSLTPDGSAPITPANYNTVNQKSKDSAASAPVVNVSNNTSNNMSGGGGGSSMPNMQAANGVSSRQPTFSKAI